MEQSMKDMQIVNFMEELSSKAPVPGGGGASALVGAIGVSLGNMVGSLTVGKKTYAAVEEDVKKLMEQAEQYRGELLNLIDKDAVAFAPLAKAYSIPKTDPERDTVMEEALRVACSVPMEIMRTVCKVIPLLEGFAQMGSKIAISDAGVGAVCAKAALQGASLNVYINTKSMKDRAYAEKLEEESDKMLAEYCARADKVYENVVGRIR